ncbi:MAG: WD40 repeat domain-containing protein [Nitrospiraceae bacterium]|nr:WD40 repeat domain-containing protein [Nitrospiraceae bacterium]
MKNGLAEYLKVFCKKRVFVTTLIIINSLVISGLSWAVSLHKILYIHDGEFVGQLCSVVPAKGMTPVCLADGGYGSPSWRPHGNLIAAELKTRQGTKLVILNKNGRLVRALSKSKGCYRPEWSPDGRYLYAINYRLGHAIRRWNLESHRFKDIPVRGFGKEYSYLQGISFSPNYKRAAISVDKFKKILISDVYGDHFRVRKILPGKFHYVAQSVWIDNDRLLFVGVKKNDDRGEIWQLNIGRGELWQLNVLTGKIKKISIRGLSLRDFVTLSPDHKSVVICATDNPQDPKWSLWLYKLGSPTATRITNGIEDVDPDWR